MRAFLALACLFSAIQFPVPAQALTLGEQTCTIVSCPGIPKAKIEEFKNADLRPIFLNDADTKEALRYDYRFRDGTNFHEWFSAEFDNIEAVFKTTVLSSALSEIKYLEKKFDLILEDHDYIGKTFSELNDLTEKASKQSVCRLAIHESKRNKDCNSRKNSCLGQLAYIISFGSFGSNRCREAFAYCKYHKLWDVLLKYEHEGNDVVSHGAIQVQSTVKENDYRRILWPLAHKAKKKFKEQDKAVRETLKAIPKC